MMDLMPRSKNVEKSRATITLDEEATALVRQVCKRFTRTQKEFAEYAARWLLSMPDDVAGPIMGNLPRAYEPDFAEIVLKTWAKQRTQLKAEGEPSAEKPKPAKRVPLHQTKARQEPQKPQEKTG